MSGAQQALAAPAPQGAADPLVQLLDLAHQARSAHSRDELAFLLLNDSHRLLAYRQAALWLDGTGLRGLSGVMEPDPNAPYAQWLRRLCAHLYATHREAGLLAIDRRQLPEVLAEAWSDWLPVEGLWLPVPGEAGQPAAGGLLLALDQPCPPAAWPLLQEWLHVWAHAWRGLDRPQAWWRALLRRDPPALGGAPRPAWWRRRPVQVALALGVC